MKCTDAAATNYNTEAESLVYWLHVGLVCGCVAEIIIQQHFIKSRKKKSFLI